MRVCRGPVARVAGAAGFRRDGPPRDCDGDGLARLQLVQDAAEARDGALRWGGLEGRKGARAGCISEKKRRFVMGRTGGGIRTEICMERAICSSEREKFL